MDSSNETQVVGNAAARTAPRVTPQEVEWSIESCHYFTGAEGVLGMLTSDGVEPNSFERANAAPASLGLLTICVLVLRNGFTVVGKSACASSAIFDADIGNRLAREDAVRQVWPLLGYALRDRLFHAPRVAPAIAQLQVAIETLDTNEPINREAGNVDQANLEAVNAEACRLAIALLTP